MNFFYVPVILICSMGTPCNENTALDIVRLEVTNTPVACLIAAQSKVASLAFAPKNGEEATYLVKCEKSD